MVLIEVKSNGKVVGRCDAKCYEAEHDVCDCCCCGKNHRKGLKQALENTRSNGELMIDQFCAENKVNVDQKILLNENVEQMKLF